MREREMRKRREGENFSILCFSRRTFWGRERERERERQRDRERQRERDREMRER